MSHPAAPAGCASRPSTRLWVLSSEHECREGTICAGRCTFPRTGAGGTHNSQLTTQNWKGGRSGFSLIEVLISMAILSILVAGTLGLFTSALHRLHDGRSLTRASALARGVIERVSRPSAHVWFDASGSSSSVEKVWMRRGKLDGELEVTPAESGGEHAAFRNELREAFIDAALPYGSGDDRRNDLQVRIEAVPAGTTFANAPLLRIQVRVRWTERGVRSRYVQLETLQVRSEP